MSLTVTPTCASCGATVTGVDLTQPLSEDLVAELRAEWLKHKVLVFPNQPLSNRDLERFTEYFGELGEDPFFGHIEGHEHICAIQRAADENVLPHQIDRRKNIIGFVVDLHQLQAARLEQIFVNIRRRCPQSAHHCQDIGSSFSLTVDRNA